MKTTNKRTLAAIIAVISITVPALTACKQEPEPFRYTGQTYTYGDFQYREHKDYMVISGYTGNETSVTIPAQINGKPVTGIYRLGNDNEFYNSSIVSLTIPASITGFMFPEGVGHDSISSVVFFLTSVASITVDVNNPVYASADGILYNKAKTEIIFVPYAITGNVTIPNGVTSIDKDRDFSGRDGLAGIRVDANNPVYASADGVLYNKAKTEIIFVPNAITGNVTIPNGVTSIKERDFSGCTSLASITIPDSVTSVRTPLLTSTLWYSLLL